MDFLTAEERFEYDMRMLGREELPNSALNEEDEEILAIGTAQAKVVEKDDAMVEGGERDEENEGAGMEEYVIDLD